MAGWGTPLRLMLCATGSANDRLASAMLRHVKANFQGEVQAFGVGGEQLVKEGFDSLVPSDAIHSMHSADMLPRLPFFSKLMHPDDTVKVPSMMDYIKHLTLAITAAAQRQPDAIVFVGSLFLSTQFLAGYKTATSSHKVKPAARVQLMGPAAGDFRVGKRALKLWRRAHQVDHLLCALPHEPPLLRQHGLAATYVGHPVIDSLVDAGASVQASGSLQLADSQLEAAEGFREATAGLPRQRHPEAPLVWLAPGEHERDLTRTLPLFDAVMRRVQARHPRAQCVVAVPEFWRNHVRDALSNYCCPAHLVALDGDAWPSLLAADVALTCSGTATTMAAAAAHTPLVAATPASLWSDGLAYRLSSSKAAGAPNLVLGPGAVPEVVAWGDSAAEQLAAEVCLLLHDNAARLQQVEALQRFQAALLPAPPLPGHRPLLPAEAAALAVLDVAETHRSSSSSSSSA